MKVDTKVYLNVVQLIQAIEEEQQQEIIIENNK